MCPACLPRDQCTIRPATNRQMCIILFVLLCGGNFSAFEEDSGSESVQQGALCYVDKDFVAVLHDVVLSSE